MYGKQLMGIILPQRKLISIPMQKGVNLSKLLTRGIIDIIIARLVLVLHPNQCSVKILQSNDNRMRSRKLLRELKHGQPLEDRIEDIEQVLEDWLRNQGIKLTDDEELTSFTPAKMPSMPSANTLDKKKEDLHNHFEKLPDHFELTIDLLE
jgi:hypothetical protein